MIDFNTNRLIIVCYPRGAGGKFLINALGLSNGAVFQDNDLAMQQLSKLFTPEDKLAYIQTQVELITDQWTDLNLGCYQLFGMHNENYFQNQPVEINQNIQQIIDQGLYFFIVAHDASLAESYLSYWPNAKIIIFKNTENFLAARYPSSTHPHVLSSTDFEYQSKRFNSRPTTLWWNTSWFFSQDDTLAHIKELYDTLGLSDFNQNYISAYYTLWVNKLEQMNKQLRKNR